MQEDFRLIVDLVTVLAAAAAGGILAAVLRQPILLGYLLAGMVVGPAGLGLIKELIQVETLAQFGVAFLLFALGVEFSFSELKKGQRHQSGRGRTANRADDRHHGNGLARHGLGHIARARGFSRRNSFPVIHCGCAEVFDGA